jgi:hypothetical protein
VRGKETNDFRRTANIMRFAGELFAKAQSPLAQSVRASATQDAANAAVYPVHCERGWRNAPAFFASACKKFYMAKTFKIQAQALMKTEFVIAKSYSRIFCTVVRAIEFFDGGVKLPP